MKFSDFPFLRYFLFFTAGIFLETILPENLFLTGVILGVSWTVYLALIVRRASLSISSSLAYIQLVALGVFCATLYQMSLHKPKAVSKPYYAEVIQEDIPKANSSQNLLRVYFDEKDGELSPKNEQVLIYHQFPNGLKNGQIIKIGKAPDKLQAPVSPYEFDYKSYLEKRGISYNQFVRDEISILDSVGFESSRPALAKLRQSLVELIQLKIDDPKAEQIALALLIGQREYLERDTKSTFSETGVMHVLAVSGLHVGILVTVLLFLVKPFALKGVVLKWYLLGVVICIWCYAALTGFTPSVIRASVMFTLITLGQMRDRKPSIFNVLAFSVILMTVVEPTVIFEVGFQLSYLAVLGIVLIQPLIVKWWVPSSKFLEYLWQLVAVSLAAQLATFPLTIFYFHSFPPWFLVANILVIPLTFVVMQIGIPFLVLGWVPIIGSILGRAVDFLLRIELWVLDWVQSLPFGKITGLNISPFSMMIIWGILLVWAAWGYYSKKNLIYTTFILAGIWLVFTVVNTIGGLERQLIIYRGKQGVAVDYWDGFELKSYNSGFNSDEIGYKIDPYRIRNNWGIFPKALQVLSFENDLILIPDAGISLRDSSVLITSKISKVEYFQGGNWVLLKNQSEYSLKPCMRILF